jgi:hypothetical protein
VDVFLDDAAFADALVAQEHQLELGFVAGGCG